MKKILYLLSLSIFTIACKKNDVGTSSSVSVHSPDVYVVGYEKSKTGKYIAKYWKNGTAVPLTDGSTNAYAVDISIVGNDVYVAGEDNAGIKYWKNGTAINLTDGTKYAEALGIFVAGNDAYVVGEENDSAKYWKNGVSVSLPLFKPSKGELIRSKAKFINISGNDIYIIGLGTVQYKVDTPYGQGTGTELKDSVILWKNGSIELNNEVSGFSRDNLIGMKVVGHDVYLVAERQGTEGYWKNGTWVNLPILNFGYYRILGFTISGNDIYRVGGLDISTTTQIAQYWKNGTAVPLTDGSTNAYTQDITIVGNDVYVAGIDNAVIKYWKNGTAFPLTDGSTEAQVKGILVK